MYTKENKSEIYNEIYFLNDNNIAFNKTSMSCDAGFNAVASQKEFVEVYKEFEKVSADFYVLSDNVEISAATLDKNIKSLSVGLSTEVDKKFLPISGGSIENLIVNQDLNVNGNILLSSEHGKLSINLEHNIDDIYINNRPFSAYTNDAINKLSAGPFKSDKGQIVDSIIENAGILSVKYKELISSDIPLLPEDKIENLTSNYATKKDLSKTELNYISNEKRIVLINSFIGISDEIDVSDFIKDGMISSVTLDYDGNSENPKDKGPYIHIIWNTDGENKDTWLPLKEFVNIYTSDGTGIKVNDYKISLDYNEISEKLEIPELKDYTKELSTPVTGIIDTLSAGVDNALSSDILAIKFCGHITLTQDESKRSLVQILETAGLFDEQNRIKNGSAYKIELVKSSNDLQKSTDRYLTTDGLTLGDGDYIYIHKHGLDIYVNKDELAISGGNKNVYLANPVHKYDIAELHQFVVDNFVKLSGNNEISNDNRFLGDLSIDQNLIVSHDTILSNNLIVGNESEFKNTLSIDFDKLYNTVDDITLFGLSTGLSNEIKSLSSALSTEIDSLSVGLSTEIDNLSIALSTEIIDLSIGLSNEIKSLSSALSTEIIDLSTNIDQQFLNIKNSINKILPPTNSFEENCNTVEIGNIISCLMDIRDIL